MAIDERKWRTPAVVMVAGCMIGLKISKYIPEQLFKKVVLYVVLISSFLLFVKSFYAYDI